MCRRSRPRMILSCTLASLPRRQWWGKAGFRRPGIHRVKRQPSCGSARAVGGDGCDKRRMFRRWSCVLRKVMTLGNNQPAELLDFYLRCCFCCCCHCCPSRATTCHSLMDKAGDSSMGAGVPYACRIYGLELRKFQIPCEKRRPVVPF